MIIAFVSVLTHLKAEILTQQLDLSFCGLLTLALLQTFQIGTDESTVAHNHRTRLHAMAKTHLPRVTLWVEDTFSLKVGVDTFRKAQI